MRHFAFACLRIHPSFVRIQISGIPVTSYVLDVNSSGLPYYIQSDGHAGPMHGVVGEYDNGYQTVISFLNANTYNHEPPGRLATRFTKLHGTDHAPDTRLGQ